MKLFGPGKRRPGWLCIILTPERVDVSHVLTAGKARPEILLCDSFRKEDGDVATLSRLRGELDLDRYRCTTLLHSRDYQVLQVDAPNVPAAEFKAAMPWRIKDLIDYPVEAATVDVLKVPTTDGARGNQQVFAVSARNEVIAATVKPFNDAKIPLDVIDIPELAQRNLAHCFEEPGRALACVSFDESGGLLTFTHAGELCQYRRIDMPARAFADAPADQRPQLYDRVVLELQRSLDNFDRQFNHLSVSRVMLTPVPGAEDLQQYLADNLGLPVALIDLAEIMDFPGIPELREPSRQAQCVAMIGAAMRTEAAA
jgi:MSHA biogenesis protein MshI